MKIPCVCYGRSAQRPSSDSRFLMPLFLFPLWEKYFSYICFHRWRWAFYVPHTHTQKDEVSSFLIKSYWAAQCTNVYNPNTLSYLVKTIITFTCFTEVLLLSQFSDFEFLDKFLKRLNDVIKIVAFIVLG